MKVLGVEKGQCHLGPLPLYCPGRAALPVPCPRRLFPGTLVLLCWHLVQHASVCFLCLGHRGSNQDPGRLLFVILGYGLHAVSLLDSYSKALTSEVALCGGSSLWRWLWNWRLGKRDSKPYKQSKTLFSSITCTCWICTHTQEAPSPRHCVGELFCPVSCVTPRLTQRESHYPWAFQLLCGQVISLGLHP